ncbi:MAG: glutamine--tRNA ligase/YqeY domain fusion protein [Clostridiales bacterium]|jgi:glutaminyl-tRNA synthetase|nr:glutamine--tRNA ligase/YqeY domain fusion protein [Clostridiales bacterium]
MEHDKNQAVIPGNFIQSIINRDLETEKYGKRVHTRFPPEPNGYLHIGHAKSICLNFGLALEYGGLCNLRFDDTNPSREEEEFSNSIMEDVHWLGFDWQDRLYYASDYFEELYQYAVQLIEKGLAYVCDLSQEEMRLYRGSPTEPGRLSPYAGRSVEENLQLFSQMRRGSFADGAKVLRARIDMASPNFNLRDPVLYRIQRSHHQRTGEGWIIYPMYDYAHPISDALEGITHSICTLEFENHRPLYDWCLANIDIPCKSQQIEFARLNITNTVMSKRKLRRLVEEGFVEGWDDPRMPTLAGMRRRGYPPAAIRSFCEKIGVAKANSTVDFGLLEHCVREDLNYNADRAMAIIRPLKVVLTNYPDGQREELPADNNPEQPERGKRLISFGNQLYIEADDFMEEPVKGFHRLIPGGEVRLKHAYIIKCEKVIKNEAGEVVELHCTYDENSKSGSDTSGKKIKGTIHWLDRQNAVRAQLRLYGHLFNRENPEESADGEDFTAYIDPNSLVLPPNSLVEASLADAEIGKYCQFLRQGYFVKDKDSQKDLPVFNRIVSLKAGWKPASLAQS